MIKIAAIVLVIFGNVSSIKAAPVFQFSVIDFLDLIHVSEADGVLTEQCAQDFQLLIVNRNNMTVDPEFNEKVLQPKLDSSGKIGPAILRGHSYFAGHYSECKSVRFSLPDREFRGDYFKVEVDTAGSEDACTTNSTHFTFGLCLPASCSSAELIAFFRPTNSPPQFPNPVCKVKRTGDSIAEKNAGFYITLSIMGIITAVCVLSGIADYFFSDILVDKPVIKSIWWRLVKSCSLYANIASIFEVGASKEGQIAPLHCIRFFSICWVAMGHFISYYFRVIANPSDFFDILSDLTTEFVANAYFAVDSFFYIGGVLLTFLWFKNYYRNPRQTNSATSWVMFYVHRILRLSPAFYILVVFFTFVLKQMLIETPMNMTLYGDHCSTTWWLELLYIHNFVEYDSICLTFSWYLAADMQMYLFTPLLILPLAIKPVIGFVVAAAVFILSTGANIWLVYFYDFPATDGFPHNLQTDYDFYEMILYQNPLIRCQVYIMGLLVGWLLQTKKRMRVNWLVNLILWCISLVLMLTVVLGTHSQSAGEQWSVFWRAMYSALSRPAWALGLSWMLIACYFGYGGPINAFMSWHIWVPLGRLSYCAYLIHIPIIYLTLGQTTDEIYFSGFMDMFVTRIIPVIVLTFSVSIFWSALFEISFGKIEMLLLGGLRTPKPQERPLLKKDEDIEKIEEEQPERLMIKGTQDEKIMTNL